MSNFLYRLGRSAASRPWTAIGAWVVLALVVIASSAAFGRELEESFEAPGLDSYQAAELLSEAQADEGGVSAHVVLEAPDATTQVAPIEAALAELPHVLGTTSSVSPDGDIALVRVQYPAVEELEASDLDNLKDAVADLREESSLTLETGGDLFFAFEEAPTGLGEVAGILVAMIVLLIAFGSFVAMGLPIGMALFGLVIGITSMKLVTYLIDIPAWAPELAAMVGLGVGIDYALFLVTRHRENLAAGMPVPEAVGRALATAGQAVIFAGGTVVVAILGLLVAGIPFVTGGGVAISAMVLVMVLASVTLLPALLGLAGQRLKGQWINGRRRRDGAHRPSTGWYRWGAHVTRNATAYLVGGAVFMIALAAPVLALNLGFPDDGTKPESRTERRAYDLIAEGFGPGANGPLVIAVDISQDKSVVAPLAEAVAADPGITAVGEPIIDLSAGVATLVAQPTTSPQDVATQETVTRLRSEVFPTVLDGSSATAHVGGQTATFADLGDRVQERMPRFVAAVLLLSFLLLAVLFRSVLVPLKAVVLNLLSVGAAYGVLVMVFQWGWAAGLIGVESTVPIVSFIPLFMFAILFGLSMDYEVFLLSRVREQYRRHGDNTRAVIEGIAGTGRTITAAALIMVAVFSGFVLGSDPVVKMMGVGLATAIFLDATVVRLILVPATMKLLGDANWWLPRWLDRLLPELDSASVEKPAEMELPQIGV
ncbi:MMPL family transporter [Nocardioides albus]|uniref:RND superfamily putative drug exporter n=1 Tax=Nocardioides albus TaxID=1841 RepID=A0A7W5A454_9ACTN|nr:MMPL family transporter [Nocardioides albus]MBB3089196.1 RND superfamily putative drug exporter [Nocardioides albus]GGU13620.1 membrane protein [Nocardioides albus]